MFESKEPKKTTDKPHDDKSNASQQKSLPSISLPKGGGAIKGIGEKFSVNPVTGTGSLNVPIYTSPGRSGFGPLLSLAYDSGAGNGPFGLGWNLSIPSITRKTDKGLPKYQDEKESDVFILSGAEDLVPVFEKDKKGEFKKDVNGNFVIDEHDRDGYTVRMYRPRTEGLFARIERWTHKTNGDVHWRSISKDNILTVYGKRGESKISDPSDESRVFSWLVSESYDDKGNAIVYEYAKEDEKGIEDDLLNINERNRTRIANRYIKRIFYGNRRPLLLEPTKAGFRKSHLEISEDELSSAKWMFEVVFDYDEEHYKEIPLNIGKPRDEQHQLVESSALAGAIWSGRPDPFSNFRAGFEIRTYRLCKRILMFHHFVDDLGIPDYLVRSTEFSYDPNPVASFITSITQSGFVLDTDGKTYLKKAMPPLEFEYTKATINKEIKEIDSSSLENIPSGVDGIRYQWIDLDGDGLSGILTEQGGAWFYKHNLSSLPLKGKDGEPIARFEAQEKVVTLPSSHDLNNNASRQHLTDLTGDGQVDLVQFDKFQTGYFKRTPEQIWEPFVPFSSIPNVNWNDPNLKFVDLTGDGHPDILITEEQVFTWYPSLAEKGFGYYEQVRKTLDEEDGPKLVFADIAQSVYLADMSGDGLTDLVRIRNGEICYWPNLGYGKFGTKVTMNNSPQFDFVDQFDNRRIRLVDTDGSGTTDVIYLGINGTHLYLNQSGNSWKTDEQSLIEFPRADNLSSVTVTDLFGNGTACLLWSSPLPGEVHNNMRYIDLMGGVKPYLLVSIKNNMGAETRMHYVPSTRFYLMDKYAGKPWITRLPFPVQVVERIETFDWISRNYFVTRYAYHHGYFDGIDREFRGFGLVEQFDTEEFSVLSASETFPKPANIEESSHIPPVHTKTWFHTGAYFQGGKISGHYETEYYVEPGQNLLSDTIFPTTITMPDGTTLPVTLTVQEEREACRALKGSILRQEIYALDNIPDKSKYPYSVSEQNYTIELVQKQSINQHGIFFVHPREAIDYHYEREPNDPSISHTMTLEVDGFGNALKQGNIGYGRLKPDPDLLLAGDSVKQTKTLITYSESTFTNSVNLEDVYRAPLPSETSTYELTGYMPTSAAGRYQQTDFVQRDPLQLILIRDSEIDYEVQPSVGRQRRLIERVRTLYRRDDMTALLELGELQPLSLIGENYKLAFTPGLLAQIFQQKGVSLIPDAHNVLGSHKGGYLSSQQLKIEGKFPSTDPDNYWWIPTGRVFLSPISDDTSAQELTYATSHFFLPHRYRDPFHTDALSTESFVRYDSYDLLLVETRDALGNRITVGERLIDGTLNSTKSGNDYRVLQLGRMMDQNRNRTVVSYDILGMVVGTALMGKPEETLGDSLDGFEADLTQAQIEEFYDASDPHILATLLLGGATTRIIYDVYRFQRTHEADPEDSTKCLPAYAVTLARESHLSDPPTTHGLKIQIRFSYFDGFQREIQKKFQAEPGPLVEGGPVVNHRWVGSGWIIFNNKGKPVRKYEPFFSQLSEKQHHFEFGLQKGVSLILFYDPLERVIATLHPNHSYDKVVFSPWKQITSDVNDTIRLPDNAVDPPFNPKNDPDVGPYFSRLLHDEYLPTWYDIRTDPAKALKGWPNTDALGHLIPDNIIRRNAEKSAADKAAAHADTPFVAYFDTLGRSFLTTTYNKVVCKDHELDGTEDKFHTRIGMDIEGNQRSVCDEIKQNGDKIVRIVTLYDYDMLGNRISQSSMEAGERWMLNDVAGKPIRTWDSRGHVLRTEYDPLRRPLRIFVTGTDHENPKKELLTERLMYGEQHPNGEKHNLRNKLYCQLDQSGLVTNESHDFKGNPLSTARRLTKEYRRAVDWRELDSDHVALPPDTTKKLNLSLLEKRLETWLEKEIFTSFTTYDALNRPIQVIAPHSDQPGVKYNVIQPVYNEANLLEQVDSWLDCSTKPTGLLDPAITPSNAGVKNIDYDAKGQRLRIDYHNGTSTFHVYDQLTFRLVHLLTLRNAVTFPQDCPHPPTADWSGCQVQNLHYTYDPIGNITHIRDDAQQRIFFRNLRVEPSAEYTYDAIYRLVKATGREHLGQVGGAPTPHTYNDISHVGLQHPNDGRAMGNYTELYVYDTVDNILKIQHYSGDLARPGWTRSYIYEETSFIEDGTNGTLVRTNNALSSTTVAGNHPSLESYSYDDHGNMTKMPQLQVMQWDYRDQLYMTQRQKVNDQDEDGLKRQGERTYYTYDSTGQRSRKITELASGNLKDERIYLNGFELYRHHFGINSGLVRESLHIMDDKLRIALVETRNGIDDGSPRQLIAYQFSNHLGSGIMELDEKANIIHYEEYYPYGSTSYQSVISNTRRRYRYTDKERDEETGFTYHGARYYAPWLGRWTAAERYWLGDGTNFYAYVRDNPVGFHDPDGKQAKLKPGTIIREMVPTGKGGYKIIDHVVQPPPKKESIPAPQTKNLGVFNVDGVDYDYRFYKSYMLRGTDGKPIPIPDDELSDDDLIAKKEMEAKQEAEKKRDDVLGVYDKGQEIKAKVVVATAFAVTAYIVSRVYALIPTVIQGYIGKTLALAQIASAKGENDPNLTLGIVGYALAPVPVPVASEEAFVLHIGAELDALPGEVVLNPGRQAMSIEKLRKLIPNKIIEASAEEIPLGNEVASVVRGKRLPNSIDWSEAASEFKRVLVPGGKVEISVYGDTSALVSALEQNGFRDVRVVSGVFVTAVKP